MVCNYCGFHHPIGAKARIDMLVDEGSFEEIDASLTTANPLGFEDYMDRIEKDKQKSGLNEAIVTGHATIGGNPLVIAVMDSRFRMASMGSVVGEKFFVLWKMLIKQINHLLFSLLLVVRVCRRGCFPLCKWRKLLLHLNDLAITED